MYRIKKMFMSFFQSLCDKNVGIGICNYRIFPIFAEINSYVE